MSSRDTNSGNPLGAMSWRYDGDQLTVRLPTWQLEHHQGGAIVVRALVYEWRLDRVTFGWHHRGAGGQSAEGRLIRRLDGRVELMRWLGWDDDPRRCGWQVSEPAAIGDPHTSSDANTVVHRVRRFVTALPTSVVAGILRAEARARLAAALRAHADQTEPGPSSDPVCRDLVREAQLEDAALSFDGLSQAIAVALAPGWKLTVADLRKAVDDISTQAMLSSRASLPALGL